MADSDSSQLPLSPLAQFTEMFTKEFPNHKFFKAEYGKVFRFDKAGENFDLYLEGPFPTTARLYKVSPSISTLGMDLLGENLQQPWTSSKLLSLLLENLDPNAGRYHLGHTFPVYLFAGFPSFTLTANNPSNLKVHQQVKIILTDCYFYQIAEYKQSGYLIAYGTLKSIKSIKTLEQNPNSVCVTWRGPIDYVQVFTGSQASELIDKILVYLEGVKFTKSKMVKKTIKEEDVTPSFILKIKINDIEAEIIETELELETEMTKEKINLLLELYQKAIEYYSAFGDERFDGYLAKVRALMGNSDVLRVLTQEEIVIKREESRIVEEFEQQEVWPENFERKDS